jgi:hypothetical protein
MNDKEIQYAILKCLSTNPDVPNDGILIYIFDEDTKRIIEKLNNLTTPGPNEKRPMERKEQ